jgi:hypothetical protein
MGAIALNAATLHAVKVPARPAVKAKRNPAAEPAMPVVRELCPSKPLAVLTPISSSTNFADHKIAAVSPASMLNMIDRRRRTGYDPLLDIWAASSSTSLPAMPIRLRAKGYGKCRLGTVISGGSRPASPVLLFIRGC